MDGRITNGGQRRKATCHRGHPRDHYPSGACRECTKHRVRARYRRLHPQPRAIVTPAMADALVAAYVRGQTTQAALAAQFGIDQRTVSAIVRGQYWTARRQKEVTCG